MVPGGPPPSVHCVPFSTDRQCVLYRASLSIANFLGYLHPSFLSQRERSVLLPGNLP